MNLPALALAASAALAGCLALGGCRAGLIRPTTTEVVASSSDLVERGSYVVNGIAGCGDCHSSHANGDWLSPEVTGYLNGGNILDEENAHVRVWMPNITPDVETGIGGWTDDELMRAIRDGIHKDGHVLFPMMPYTSYRAMSDDDVRAVVAYLRTVPPQEPETLRFEPEMSGMMRFLFQKIRLTVSEPAAGVRAPDPNDPVRYGEYLGRIGGCVECHSYGPTGARPPSDPLYMAGSAVGYWFPTGLVHAPNLTSEPETGLGKRTAGEIEAALLAGKRLDGRPMLPPMSFMSSGLRNLTNEDLDALVAWIVALPPAKNQVPPATVTERGEKWLADAAEKEVAQQAAAAARARAEADERAAQETRRVEYEARRAIAEKVVAATRTHVDGLVAAGKGKATIADVGSKPAKKLALEFVELRGEPFALEGRGMAVHAIFKVAGAKDAQLYDVDFWLMEAAGGTLTVAETAIHQAPKKDGTEWTMEARYDTSAARPVQGDPPAVAP